MKSYDVRLKSYDARLKCYDARLKVKGGTTWVDPVDVLVYLTQLVSDSTNLGLKPGHQVADKTMSCGGFGGSFWDDE